MPRSRKRQTQLAFSPVASSSRAASPYNQQIRDRAANVRFDGSPRPSKRRRVEDAPKVKDHPGKGKALGRQGLLTPDASSDLASKVSTKDVVDQDDYIPISSLPSKRSSRNRAKQQKLAFDSSAVSSRTTSSPMTTKSPKVEKPVAHEQPSFFGSQKKKRNTPRALDDSSDDEEEDDIVLSHDVSHSQGPPVRPTRAGKGEAAISQYTRSSMSRRETVSSSNSATPKPKAADNLVDLGAGDSETDPDDLPVTPARRRRNAGHRAASPVALDSDNDGDSDIVLTGRSRRSRKASSPVQQHDYDLGDEDESEEEAEEQDEEQEAPRGRRRLRRPVERLEEDLDGSEVVELSSGSEDEDGAMHRKQQKEARRKEEQQELEDDLLDLQSGSEGEAEIRAAKKPQLSARAKALEKLKQKRTGVETIGIDDDDDDGEESEDELPESSATFASHIIPDEEDEEFLIDEEGDTLGVPDGMPIQFTKYASMKAKELFKFAVEWMVQKKLNPAFQINDEIYDLTFKKLDDEVKGLAGSKFVSAAWTPQFAFALRARPQIALEQINRNAAEHFMRDKCDACNRSGHPATWQIQFQGHPYFKETLEEVEPYDDGNSDDDSDEDNEGSYNRDTDGREIVPEDTTFYVGKFCMANAETAHALSHWRIHLYEWIVDWLERGGHLSPEQIVRRDKWSESKRRKKANKIVDRMIQAGKVGELYRDFKDQIDQARNSKQGRFEALSP